jgi:hypothetical protein
MEERAKHPGGRPKGIRYPRQFSVYETDRGLELLKAIADRWDTTQADAIRRLIREKAAELGLADGKE